MTSSLLVALVLAAETPAGMTISGGVSLGAWESGYVYFHTQANAVRPTTRLRIATGTSAGSANALLALISSCRESEPLPMQSLAWNLWGPVGLKQLFDKKRASADALFVRDEMSARVEHLHKVWNEGLPADCDVVWGASVTRVEPRNVVIKPGLSAPRVLETFVVRIEGRGPGKPPRVSNYVGRDMVAPVPLLPFADDTNDPEASNRNFSLLRDVMFASAAFPVAFSPAPIEYCLSKPGAEPEKALACTQPEYLDYFIDGGLFDNSPLRVAWSMVNSRLLQAPNGGSRWESPVNGSDAALRTDTRLIFVDPYTNSFPDEEGATPKAAANDGLVTKLLSITGGFISSARSTELSQLAREPELAERMDLVKSNLPRASAPLNAFAGFFETEFRRFDFYLGMYDAFLQLSQTPEWKDQPIELEKFIASSDEARTEWAPFLCMVGMTQTRFAEHRKACEDPALINFRIVLQVSLDRLTDACTRDTKTPAFDNALCLEARVGIPTPHVPGVKELSREQLKRGNDESGFDYTMRLLGEYQFEFKDLGLSRDESKRGALMLRQALDPIVDTWSNAQPTFVDRVLTRTALRAGLNSIEYSPAPFTLYAVLGTLQEVGLGFSPAERDARWFQLHGALTLGQLFSLFTDKRPRLSFNLTTGPMFNLSFISNAVIQPSLAVRGGVQLGVYDGFGTQKCLADFSLDQRACTQPVAELMLGITILERLRAELVWQTYPRLMALRTAWSYVHLAIGVRFY